MIYSQDIRIIWRHFEVAITQGLFWWLRLWIRQLRICPQCRRPGVWSLGLEDPLKKGIATHTSILAWRIPWTKEPGRLQSMGSQRVRHDWATEHAHMSRQSPGEIFSIFLINQDWHYHHFFSRFPGTMKLPQPSTSEEGARVPQSPSYPNTSIRTHSRWGPLAYVHRAPPLCLALPSF